MTNIFATISVSTIEELNNVIQNDILGNIKFSGASKHFRGQSSTEFVLQTRIASTFPDPATVQIKANQIFNSLRQKLRAAKLTSEIFVADMNQGLYEKVYYTVFQAQHLGIPTPFMDWSFNWRNALYFAIENEYFIDKPGQLWVMLRPYYQQDNVFSLNPYYLEEDFLINAAYDAHAELEKFLGEKRRHNQAGQFYVLPHDNCVEPMETNKSLRDASLLLIEIQPSLKQQIYELREKTVDDELINLMRSLRLDFKRYDNNSIYGNMTDELKAVVNSVRSEFGFSTL
ncbi:FRG domain-containing protein [Microcoleus sp. F10-A1]|uniref:FRG domain-containing protein n=1 Tax=Microcoleus sp. F10-A1 TaxID=2818750 RepID=UPI002FD4214E